MTKPLKPSLKFISKLPTIKIKEEVETPNMVIWKVELDKPVNILPGYATIKSLMKLNTFFIEAITRERFSQEKGWQSDIMIGITLGKGDVECLIDPREEEWYLKNEWWKFSG